MKYLRIHACIHMRYVCIHVFVHVCIHMPIHEHFHKHVPCINVHSHKRTTMLLILKKKNSEEQKCKQDPEKFITGQKERKESTQQVTLPIAHASYEVKANT
jgi:hypothetical protein